MTARFRVVSLRPPAPDGSGDSCRASSIIDGLRDGGAEVEVVSLLADTEGLAKALMNLQTFAELLKMLLRDGRSRPVQWIAVQALQHRAAADAPVPSIYVTSRMVPWPIPDGAIVDFVDSLAANAAARSGGAHFAACFWRREARLLHDWESLIAKTCRLATAVSSREAELIGPTVIAVPLQRPATSERVLRTRVETDSMPRIIFPGNLFYHPNREAAEWVLTGLVPELKRRGWDPRQVIVAGRRPSKSLRRHAVKAGVAFMPDVEDMAGLIRRSSVTLAPMRLGSGVQTKVLDSLRAGTPAVITPKANQGLDLRDSQMLRVVDRAPEPFADAIESLIASSGGSQIPQDVQALLEASTPEAVHAQWRSLLLPLARMS